MKKSIPFCKSKEKSLSQKLMLKYLPVRPPDHIINKYGCRAGDKTVSIEIQLLFSARLPFFPAINNF
jgi:hypothetical protein